MSKAVKQIVSVAAMIAIPYFAPMIAGSAALAGVSATIGTTATSALVGAGLGAAKGAVLGEDIGRSALMGGIGGGVAGYTAAPTAAGTQAPVYDVNAAGQVVPAPGYGSPGLGTTGAAGAGELSMTGTPVRPFTEYFGDAAAPGAAPAAGLDTSGLSGAASVPAAQLPAAGTTAAAGAARAPQTFSEALKAKFTDPSAQADLTLRAAGMLAGSALAGSGLSPEEQSLLSQQTEELRQLQQTNQALFNQRLEQAQNLAGESKYFDPEYFGLQSARRAQTAGAVAKRAGLRGLTGDRRESEARRFDIESGRRTGTAYDTGFMSAISPRVQTQQVGLAAMPTSGPSVNYAGLQGAYNTAATRQRQTQADIGDLFGTLTSNPRSRG